MRPAYRAAAVAYLRRVASETRAAWGEAQAAKCTAELRIDIKSLSGLPLRFPELEGSAGMRRLNSGRHAVFYQVLTDRIEIVRVLHAATDLERWLG